MDFFSNPVFKIITLLADICVICFIFSYLVAKKRDKVASENRFSAAQTSNAGTTYPDTNRNIASNALSSEMVAVITAAVMASIQSNNNSGLRVKSIKRIGHTTPIWNVAGRNEYILTRL